MRRLFLVVSLGIFFTLPTWGKPTLQSVLGSRAEATLEDLRFELPPGWSLHQDIADAGKLVLGFKKNLQYVTLFVAKPTFSSIQSYFTEDIQIVENSWTEPRGDFNWELRTTSRTLPESVGGGIAYITSFRMDFKGKEYLGFAKGASAGESRDAAYAFIDRTQIKSDHQISVRSLTGEDYTGKKYYFGWGAAMSGDPSLMQNEVKYDVLHTHDIFTKEIGGNYLGSTLIGAGVVKRKSILEAWQKIGDAMTWNDMYVQYSSGHGSPTGLEVGVNYTEIRDNALSYPAKEVIIFVMACRSGGLVNAFNDKKSLWANWADVGRTLMVMTSSSVSVDSSTGPGTDPDQPGGPSGSAGSAFGHALWKSLIGYADGFIDGVKDGYLSLGEIQKYTLKRTKEVGGHAPVTTGIYSEGLIMNRVPPKAFRDQLEQSSEGLSEAQLMKQIEALDQLGRLTSF